MQNTNHFKAKEWCPEADSNHRHADFQSAALPTELSGRLSLFAFGWRVTRPVAERCPERKSRISLLIFAGSYWLCRNAIVAPEPVRQVHIRAAPRAEGAVFSHGRFAADRADHRAPSARRRSGRRSRLRLISKSPIAVQPISTVSAGSGLNAARRICSSVPRSRLGMGAKSTTT